MNNRFGSMPQHGAPQHGALGVWYDPRTWYAEGTTQAIVAATQAASQAQGAAATALAYTEQGYDQVVDMAQGVQAAGRDWLTTAQTDLPSALALAIRGQEDQWAGQQPLASVNDETHGIMLKPAETLATTYYRIAYWLWIGARIAISRNDPQSSAVLAKRAAAMGEAADKAASGLGALRETLGAGRKPFPAGIPALRAAFQLRRAGLDLVADNVLLSAQPAIRGLQTRALLGGGALLVTGTAAFLILQAQSRRNPSMPTGERVARVGGGVLLAGLGALGWLGPQAAEPVSSAIGVPASGLGTVFIVSGLTGRPVLSNLGI